MPGGLTVSEPPGLFSDSGRLDDLGCTGRRRAPSIQSYSVTGQVRVIVNLPGLSYEACCKLGAQLRPLALTRSEFFARFRATHALHATSIPARVASPHAKYFKDFAKLFRPFGDVNI